MVQDESGFRTRRARAPGQRKNSHRAVEAAEITTRSHRNSGSCHRLQPFSLRFQPRLQLIHQRFQSPASTSILHCGKTSRRLFTAIPDRSLKSNPKVRAKARESERTADWVSVKEMGQVTDQERREIWAPARGKLVVVVPAAALTITVSLSLVLKLNNVHACRSSRNRRTRKKRGEIRSRERSCCA